MSHAMMLWIAGLYALGMSEWREKQHRNASSWGWYALGLVVLAVAWFTS